ncbi:hypothetical protein [Sunxiuqinia sp. sy24]|uniref:hypothetical protein n=1 Tax=Sunxiuqinia sp. sy24 TaxID=3461495 RepID=UPI0040453B6C
MKEIEDYYKFQEEERLKELSKNESLINDFITYSKKMNIELGKDDFDYIQTIGIIVRHPNIVAKLNCQLTPDKEDLLKTSAIEKDFKKEPFASGYYFSDKFVIMAHPHFRRGYHERNSYSPRFVDVFWNFHSGKIEKYIAIDPDVVRVNVDNLMYIERDTWYGAKFQKLISEIEDGVVKLRPPLDLDSLDIEFFFGATYALDILWTSKNSVKTFQLEEFKTEKQTICINGVDYFPVRYVHAEYDIKKKVFRHFDGAIHYYNCEEYHNRRDSDFNYNFKNGKHIKTKSQKLFKINGDLCVEDWVELTSQFLSGNPLIYEYFEGKLPDRINELIEKRRN